MLHSVPESVPRLSSTTGPAYRICVRCVMDTSDSDITFDASGRCSHCTHYERRARAELFLGADGQQRLAAVVKQVQAAGRGKPYDCVIGLSGGVDSSYVAYTVKRLGLRPIAVHLDNGWNSELAVNNVEAILNHLGIDLYTHVIDWEEFCDLQLAFLKASVANSESPTDHAIIALMYEASARHGISYMITGGNIVSEAILPATWGYDSKDWRHLKAIHRRFGNIPLRTYPHFSAVRLLYYLVVKRIRIVRILNYVPYVREEAKALLQREMGWRDYGGKHHESIYTRFFQGYILPRKFGFDKRRAHLSTLICSGQTTREEALARLQEPAYPIDLMRDDYEFVIKKLGLTRAEFEEILAMPKRSHLDYPTNPILAGRGRPLARFARRVAVNNDSC